MASVTVYAGCRDCESFFEKTLSVDALTVVLDDIVFGDPVGAGHGSTLPVAAAARIRHPHLVGGGVGVGHWKYAVYVRSGVAIGASRCEGLFPVQSLSVYAGVKIELDVVVAVPAIDAGEEFVVGQFFDVRVLVAVDALQLAMNRIEENAVVDVQGNRLPPALRLESRIVVAIEAGVVVDGPQGHSDQNKNTADKTDDEF
jgi:hypothetical protein